MRLQDVNTYYFSSDQQAIRMAVGWENPQENYYDITGIDLTYNLDSSKSLFSCIDGYSRGTIVTDPTMTGVQNVTVQQWTDNLSMRDLEYNDCELLEVSLTKRPKFTETESTDPKVV